MNENNTTDIQKKPESFTQMMTPKDNTRLAELATLAQAFAISGYFKDFDVNNTRRGAAQALVKIMRGQDMGISPSASVESIYIIENRTAMSAHLMAALIRRSGAHFKVWEEGPEKCSITFYTDASEEIAIGTSVWTIEEAQKANLLKKNNWRMYPTDMLYARAVARGFRRFFSHLSMGDIYTPEELGFSVEDGRALKADVIESDEVKALESALDSAPLDPEEPIYSRDEVMQSESISVPAEDVTDGMNQLEGRQKEEYEAFAEADDPVSQFEPQEENLVHPAILKLDELFNVNNKSKLDTVFALTGVQVFDVYDSTQLDTVDKLLGRMYYKLTGKRNGPERVAAFLELALNQIDQGAEGWGLRSFAEIDECVKAFIQYEKTV